MVPNGTEGAEWYRIVPNGTEWCQMVPNVTEWYRMVQNGTKWCRMVPNGAEWCQMVALYIYILILLINVFAAPFGYPVTGTFYLILGTRYL